MAEVPTEQCGWIKPHEPHTATVMLIAVSHCPGVPKETEYRVRVQGIRAFSDLRDETAPLLRRMFPGIIVDVDERVIVSTIPGVPWRGASIDIYGTDYQLANSLEEHLYHEFAFVSEHDRDRLGMGVTILTDDERARVLAHRTTKRETT